MSLCNVHTVCMYRVCHCVVYVLVQLLAILRRRGREGQLSEFMTVKAKENETFPRLLRKCFLTDESLRSSLNSFF